MNHVVLSIALLFCGFCPAFIRADWEEDALTERIYASQHLQAAGDWGGNANANWLYNHWDVPIPAYNYVLNYRDTHYVQNSTEWNYVTTRLNAASAVYDDFDTYYNLGNEFLGLAIDAWNTAESLRISFPYPFHSQEEWHTIYDWYYLCSLLAELSEAGNAVSCNVAAFNVSVAYWTPLDEAKAYIDTH